MEAILISLLIGTALFMHLFEMRRLQYAEDNLVLVRARSHYH